MTTEVNCPHCNKIVDLTDNNNPHKPFCSKRCKLIDLGEWAAESYNIKGEEVRHTDISDDESFDEPLDEIEKRH